MAVLAAETPRIIVQITVDAMRGDLPDRFVDVTGKLGFRFLMDEGIDYNTANCQHTNTETIVGHVSLATGSVSVAHDMVGNIWLGREQGQLL